LVSVLGFTHTPLQFNPGDLHARVVDAKLWLLGVLSIPDTLFGFALLFSLGGGEGVVLVVLEELSFRFLLFAAAIGNDENEDDNDPAAIKIIDKPATTERINMNDFFDMTTTSEY
jgi:hypothetical protein